MSKTYTLSCCCVPESDAILLEFLLTLLEKQTESQWLLANDMSGDIAIYDVDEKAGLELFEQRIQKSSGPVPIAFSTDPASLQTLFKLPKPLRSADFLAVAKQIIERYPYIGHKTTREEQQAQAATIQPASNKQDSTDGNIVTNVTEIKRPTVRRLYNLLTEDQDNFRQPSEISFREVSFYIDSSAQRFYCEHKLMLLSMLCKTDISNLKIRALDSYELGKIESQIESRPLNELIWCSALLGSSGELMDSVDEKAPLHLKRWPNLKSLVHLPRHITLTAFMSKHTATLDEIVKQTRVLPDNVVDFINACKVMGYLDESISLDELKTVNVKTDSVKQGLFGKLRNKFGVKTA